MHFPPEDYASAFAPLFSRIKGNFCLTQQGFRIQLRIHPGDADADARKNFQTPQVKGLGNEGLQLNGAIDPLVIAGQSFQKQRKFIAPKPSQHLIRLQMGLQPLGQ